MCLAKWHDRLRQAKMMKRFAKRMLHLQMSQAIRGWVLFVEVRCALRQRMHVAVARWKESMQSLGLRTWLKFNACMAREEDASRHKVARMRSIVQHMQYRSLSMCMGKWQNRLRRTLRELPRRKPGGRSQLAATQTVGPIACTTT